MDLCVCLFLLFLILILFFLISENLGYCVKTCAFVLF
jgi:hypothetical protein